MIEQMLSQKAKLKSIKLTAQQKAKLKKKVEEYSNQTLAAEAMGLNDRFTLGRILKTGSCHQDTYEKIIQHIPAA